MTIRPFIFDADMQDVFALWNRTIGPEWLISYNDFCSIIEAYGQELVVNHFVAEEGNALVGFIASQSAPQGSITCIMVNERYQKKGIGSALLEKAIQSLKEKDVEKVQLGGGGYSYFWPGVPRNLPNAIKFFKKNKWTFTEKSVDMILPLKEYITPQFVYDRLDQDITIALGTPEDKAQLLQFESTYFPNWERYYKEKLEKNLFHEILLARNRTGNVLGTVIVSKQDIVWRKLVEGSTGILGALGVKEDERGKGIGLALAAKATEVLKSRKIENCYVGWTWLIDWYGKLGYRVWKEYQMSWKEI